MRPQDNLVLCADIKGIAEKHKLPYSFVSQQAWQMLREGETEPDMLIKLDEMMVHFEGRVK